MAGKMECFGATDTGCRRKTNEDQYLIADLNKSLQIHQTSLALDHQTRLFGNSQGKLILVADGMGGHQAGQRASTLAVDGIATYVLNTLRWFIRLDSQSDDDFQDDLKAAMEHCQDVLSREMRALPQNNGMGTTLTMAYIVWPRLWVVHVGDSRCYLYRDEKLKQITRDHTVAQLYKENHAESDQSDSDDAPYRHLLWNVIGGSEDKLQPEVYHLTLELGDTLLLCTDGLTHHLDDSSIAQCLRTNVPLKQVCETLIQRANTAGGNDNTTVAIARFSDVDSEMQQQEQSAEVPATEPASDPFADTDPYEEMPAATVK